ncbi:hypothetical protein SAMN02745157_2529 [Kaistia soli DSM 19436]|uniref:Uncharacterized protein n=1 Tax=Kaistia soli DSM 19436 TaxID=1122133 RepID=A0A1M5D126_9HYPH|nr:hypothetical protein [Kaistia soli]SHF60743.1 hypothetical protein SAMN02745157_2529 [Kaistia soli DSM 19436]
MADPPLCSPSDLRTWVTLGDLLDMHEALDLKAFAAEKAEREREQRR